MSSNFLVFDSLRVKILQFNKIHSTTMFELFDDHLGMMCELYFDMVPYINLVL